MALVELKCPSCGGDIKIDSAKETGFCMYCGTKILVQDTVKKIKIDRSDSLEGFLQIAQTALNGNNGKEAYEYINKVLEIDPRSSRAWIIKMRALGIFECKVGNPRIPERIACGTNSIKFASAEENAGMKNEVYLYYLENCLAYLKQAATWSSTSDIDKLRKMAAEDRNSAYNQDIKNRDIYADFAYSAINLMLEVPTEDIANNIKYQQLVCSIANQYITYSIEDRKRLAIYGICLSANSEAFRQKYLTLILKGLPEHMKAGFYGVLI